MQTVVYGCTTGVDVLRLANPTGSDVYVFILITRVWRKPLRGNDLGRSRPAALDVTPLTATTYNYFIYYEKITGISGETP